jgi:hypothetical protein
MDPNQQPSQPLGPEPQPITPPASTYTQPVPNEYSVAPQQPYDPNYLDSIAPAAPRAKFLSGGFGKIFFILIAVFVLAVSLIVAFSGKDKTADLQQISVRVTNFATLAQTEQPHLKDAKLINTNTNFTIFLTNAGSNAESLLKTAGVKKQEYSKTMTASEKAITAKLTDKFTDARLNVELDSTYASTMAVETEKLIVLYTNMSKQSGAKAIRDYAKTAVTNLTPIQKTFSDFKGSN